LPSSRTPCPPKPANITSKYIKKTPLAVSFQRSAFSFLTADR
jgi:hypothetical protein